MDQHVMQCHDVIFVSLFYQWKRLIHKPKQPNLIDTAKFWEKNDASKLLWALTQALHYSLKIDVVNMTLTLLRDVAKRQFQNMQKNFT